MTGREGAPRVGVIGCGHWGQNLARSFDRLGALAWICDSSRAALEARASTYPGVRETEELAAVLDDPTVKGIVIASPAAMHFDHASQALAAGKDIFVEKPLALTYAQGAHLVERASATGSVLMVGHVLEYHPAIEALKAIVEDGELGEIWYAYSNRLNLGKVRHEENILWSFAPHDISVITTLLGAEPDSVSASGGIYLQENIHDVTITNLTFAGPVRAHIFVSWLHPYKEQRLTVVGSRKMAVFDDVATEAKLRVLDKGIEWEDSGPVARHAAERQVELEATEPLLSECAHFLRCIESRAQPLTGPANALRVLKVLEAGQLSLDAGGRPVELVTIGKGAPVLV